MTPAQSATESVEPGIRAERRTLSRTIDRFVPAPLLAGGLLGGLLASLHPAAGNIALGEGVGVDVHPPTVGERG